MSATESRFPGVRIPFGTWGSSYFPAWQSSALAEINIGQFAGEAMSRILGLRRVQQTELDYLIIGSTIPWHWKFWNAPMVASCLGHRIPGYHLEQACATGLQAVVAAAAEVQGGSKEAVGVLTFDRTSDSPVGVFPERRSYQRTVPIADVWDNFGFDPATGNAMITTAGKAARKYKIDRREVDELALHRTQQYFEAKERGFLERYLVPLEVLDLQGKPLGRIDEDAGVRPLTAAGLRAQRELDSCVTGGTQTHASDGMATMLVTSPEKAKELSPRPEVDIRLLGKTEIRTHASLMPEAPRVRGAEDLGRIRADHERHRRGQEPQPLRRQRRDLRPRSRVRLEGHEQDRMFVGLGTSTRTDVDPRTHRGSRGSRADGRRARTGLRMRRRRRGDRGAVRGGLV